MLSPVNHKKFNDKVIEQFGLVADIDFLSRLSYKNNSVDNYFFKKRNFFSNKVLNKLEHFLNMFYVKKLFKKNRYDALYFLTYDTISSGIFFKLFFDKSAPILIHEHKNIDELRNSFLKRLIYKKFTVDYHIVYEKYIGEFIKEKYYKRYFIISHPFYNIDINISRDNDNQIFSPSSRINQKDKRKLIEICKKNNIKLFLKDSFDKREKNIIQKKRFKNYYELMKSSKFIFVANNFENRSSGVVYEALSMNKTVISIKDKFMIEMKKKYPKNIFIIDDINELPFLIKNKINSKNISNFRNNNSDENIIIQYRNLVDKLNEK